MIANNNIFDISMLVRVKYDENNNFNDFQIVRVSDNFYKITGIKSEDILGMNVSLFHDKYDDSPLDIRDLYNRIAKGNNIKIEKFIDKLNRWYSISISNMGKGHMLISFNDISEYKKAKSAIITKKRINKVEFKNPIEYYNDYIYKKKILDKSNYLDSLTGLYNRDYFYELLKKYDNPKYYPLTLLMADLNGLKVINDVFGHNSGDLALSKIAAIMKRMVRKEDVVCRVGGDEFAAILPETSYIDALAVVERIKSECNLNNIKYVKLNISIGIGTKSSNEDIYKVLNNADEMMYYKKLVEGKETKKDMLIDIKNVYLNIPFENQGHIDRLLNLTTKLAKKMNLDKVSKGKLELLCEYHDIGMIFVPEDILSKPGKLTEEECNDIIKHTDRGYRIVSAFKEICQIDDLVLNHHECWDGSGYPLGLEGKGINLINRIFKIADSYDSLTNERSYRNSYSHEEALFEIKNQIGKKFDPQVANVFLESE